MASVPAILKYLNTDNYAIMNGNDGAPIRAKKRRLDHLTWEEKLQRKKLKNRVAAQTSRDRKKARMEQMESALQELFNKNESLISECENLRLANQQLKKENTELYDRLRLPCANCLQNRSVECETVDGSTVSSSSNLQPKGRITHSAAALKNNSTTQQALWKMVLACLLYQTCSTNSAIVKQMLTSHLWNNSHKVYSKISPEIWKQLLRKQILRNQLLIDKSMKRKWWGRHQKTWNPVEAKA